MTGGDRVFYVPDETQLKVVVFYAGKRECTVNCVKSGKYTERQSRHTITNTKTDEYTQRIAR